MIRPVLESLIREGRVRRGLLGAEVKMVDKAEAKKLGISENVGVMIGGVFEGKAADKAGIQPGDIVLEADGRPTNDSSQFRNYVASTPPGTQMRLKILRNGSPQMISVTLEELTSDVVSENSGMVPALDAKVVPLTKELANQLGVPVERGGVVVMETASNGLAEQFGIQRGDIISRVDGQPIDSASSLQKAVAASREARRGTQIMVYRGNVRYRIDIE
jgi:serine protease Do